MQIIVSMTTWSKRIGSCKPTLDSILNQSRKPDLIEINLDRDNFPNERKDIPEWLVQMENDNDNLHIYFQEHDMHVWEKFVPTFRRHNEDFISVTLDCDVNYPPTYIEEIEKNMQNADWLCTQHDDMTQGQYMVYGPKAVKLMTERVTDSVIQDIDLDDHFIGHLLFQSELKRGKKIESKCEDRQEGYSFRRFFVDGYDEAELKDSTCDYPQRQFIKERILMHNKYRVG